MNKSEPVIRTLIVKMAVWQGKCCGAKYMLKRVGGVMHRYVTGDLTHSEIGSRHKTFQRASKNLTAKGVLQYLNSWGR